VGLSLYLLSSACGTKVQQSLAPPEGNSQTHKQEYDLSTTHGMFVVQGPTEGSDNDSQEVRQEKRIGIKREALGREFILRANVVKGSPSSTFSNLKTRIVSFALVEDRLYLIESSKGQSAHQDLAKSLILAELPILNQELDTIYFDFNRGMSKLYTMQDWYAQDISGSDHPTDEKQFSAMTVEVSFLKRIEFPQPETLQIVQAAQLRHEKNYIPAEIHYHLAVYNPDHDFKPHVSKEKNKVGFFEVNPTIDSSTGKTVVHASKFNLKNPIEFAISDNTPQEFRQTIKEGILYWNKAFGREVVKVIDAPAGVAAPSYTHNMVQWIDWKDAGFAYADAQMDPRTGEILNAQVYLTSAFTNQAKKKIHGLMRKLLPTETAALSAYDDVDTILHHQLHNFARKPINFFNSIGSTNAPAPQLGLKGFAHQHLCHYEDQLSFALGIAEMVEKGHNEEDIMSAVKAYLRHVVAHEIGHTLGLRHNFAGHSALNVSYEEKDTHFANYLKTHTLPETLMTSSSVMDYLQFDDTAISGQQILANAKALPYDEKAIGILYEGKTIEQSAPLPLYCTDSHTSTYVDCRRFASGPSPIAASAYKGKKLFAQLPHFLLDYFLHSAKAPSPGETAQPFDQIRLPSLALATLLLNERQPALDALKSSSRLLWLDRSYEYLSESNKSEIAKKQALWIADELVKANGWSKVLDFYDNKFAAHLSEKFNEVLAAHRSGQSSQGAYTFSDQEVEAMKGAVSRFAPILAKALQAVDLLQLATLRELSTTAISPKGDTLGDTFAAYLFTRAAVTNLTRDKEKTPAMYKIKLPVEIHGVKRIAVYAYLLEKLPEALNLVYGDPKDSSPIAVEALTKEINEKLNILLDAIASKVDVDALIKQYNLPSEEAASTPAAAASDGPSLVNLATATDATDATAAPVPASVAPANPAQLAANVEVNALIPLQLSKFSSHYLMRAIAGILLKEHASSDLHYANNFRYSLREKLEKLITSDLRGLNIAKITYENQPKSTNVWLQENRLVLGVLSSGKTAATAKEKEKGEKEE
jgi:hypothetical protein